jgi:polysaccharide biosynthesis/export protein
MSVSIRFNFDSFMPRPQTLPARLGAGALCVLFSLAAAAQTERPALLQAGQGGAAPSTTVSAGSVAGIGGLTDEPISAGQVVHVFVFNAPDFSINTRVSERGDIAYPILGAVHVAGLNSAEASKVLENQLKQHDLMLDPKVTVTVDSFSTGITILGEVRAPGIYPMPGKHLLSDLIATAGGLTGNTGRVIEISNVKTPGQKDEVPWDPTMHNTSSYDHEIHAGDRVLVRTCGIAYVGGHVAKPGAYSLCGSPQITMSELIALAGGVTPLTSEKHSYLIRVQADGTRAVQEVDLHKVLRAQTGDPEVKEDDIIYVTPSTVKDVLNRAVTFGMSAANTLFYTYHP